MNETAMKKLVILALSMSLLAGCTTLKKVTGQQDDTVLPGQRETILPPDQTIAQDPKVVGQPGVPTAPVQQPPMVAPNAKAPTKTDMATAECDPKVDLCPEPLAPDPLPPPSPVKVEKPAKMASATKPGETIAKATKKVVKKKKIKKKKIVKPVAPIVPAVPAVSAAPDVPAPPKPQGQ
jgi:hypothetical protein